MTWLFAAYSLHTALHLGAKCLLFSQTEDESKGFKDKAQFVYDHLPAAMRHASASWNQQLLSFPDLRSYLKAFPSTPRAGRSVSAARLAMFDEFAFHEWASDTMSAVAPSVESNPEGQLFIFSTANGVGNAYYAQWQAITSERGWIEPYQDGDEWTFGTRLLDAVESLRHHPDRWLAIFLPFRVRPGRDDEWRERQRQEATYVASPAKLEQEHPKQVEDAFVQTGRPVFAQADLKRQEAYFREPLPCDAWPESLRAAGYRPDELRIFELPQDGRRYLAGADVAEGLEHGDYSDLCVLDAETAREVLSLHGHWPPDVYARLIDGIARAYPGIYAIERNNHGLVVLIECDKHLHTPGLYREVAQFDPRTGGELTPAKLGWLTSSVTKPIMIDELEQAIRLDGIRLSDRLAVPELTFYQTKANGSTGAPEGGYDDRVISRAIAWQMRKHRRRTADAS